jgi:thioredoxin reductase (NADPH)
LQDLIVWVQKRQTVRQTKLPLFPILERSDFMERYDIAIIGTGPAGVSAAITAKIRNKRILLLGSRDLSEKVSKGHTIQNYPGLPAISGPDLAAALRRHLESMEIAVTEDKISAVYAMGDYFVLQGAPETYEASAVILAAGVTADKPIPGEVELLGRGVSYCATCDAPLYRGKIVAVVGFSPKEEAEAAFLAEVTEKVLYFPQYAQETRLPDAVEVIREKPISFTQENGLRQLKTETGSYPVNGIFVLRENVAPSQLVPGIETDGSRVVVDRSMATNIPGCFACGDIVGLPYQYIKSAGEGNIAALSAASYLDQKKRG